MKIAVINGPNLNMLGEREENIYGKISLHEINQKLALLAEQHKCVIDFYQSNIEGELINKIQEYNKKIDFIIINPAAYTHSSVAIRDALLANKIPFIEVHLSNIYARESFRKFSYLSDIAVGVISGLGPHSYYLALNYAIDYLKED